MTSFPESIKETYRVITTKYGNGESEETLPLGSWTKGRGIAGKRGHVYIKGEREAGVWLIHGQWPTVFAHVQSICPTAKLLQCGSGEITFSVSWSELNDLLPLIWAKRLSRHKGASAEAIAKARAAKAIGFKASSNADFESKG